MNIGLLMLNLGAAGFVVAIVMRRLYAKKKRLAPQWVVAVTVVSILCWGLGLLLVLVNRAH